MPTPRWAVLAAAIATAPLAATATAAAAHPAPPAASETGPAGTAPAAAGIRPVFPRPGGGPVAIQVWADLGSGRPWLLDPATGRYRAMPYVSLRLSPDNRTVAVEAEDDRIGLAGRTALLRDGDRAVRWTASPGGALLWSPDGRFLLSSLPDHDLGRAVAYRLDTRTGALKETVLPPWASGAAGWAADSRRYLVTGQGEPDGPIRYVNPDGTAGPAFGATGHVWDADTWSPDRRLVIVEPGRPVLPQGPPSVFDPRTGRTLTTVETDWPLLGWHDTRHVVRIAPGDGPTVLEVLNARTGRVTERVPAPGLLSAATIQLGPTTGFGPAAADLGF